MPPRRRQDETTHVQNELEKWKEEKKSKTNERQERKKEDSTQGEYACFRLVTNAGRV